MSILDKKYFIKLDTKLSTSNDIPNFSISDCDTSDMLIRITNENTLVNLTDVIVLMVAISPNSSTQADFLEVKKAEEGLIYCDLKESFKNIQGTWKARIMCIYQDEKIVTSTFSYNVISDEFVTLNEQVLSDDRYPILTEIISRLSIIELNEKQRQNNELSRIEAEKQREIIKQQLIDQINKLISDTNLKVDNSLLENSNNVTKLISDTEIKIDNYKIEKDLAIDHNLEAYKTNTTQDINTYKNNKDVEINQILDTYKTSTTKNIEDYKVAKDTQINQSLSTYENTINTLKEDFNEAVSNVTNGNESATNSEIVLARKGEKSLRTKIDKIDEQFNTKASKQEVEVERQRINSLTKLGEGSTTGDAELIDARIGYNAKIYESLGVANREQFLTLNEIIGVDYDIVYSFENKSTTNGSAKLTYAPSYFLTSLIPATTKFNASFTNTLEKNITIQAIICNSAGERTSVGNLYTVNAGENFNRDYVGYPFIRLQVRFSDYADITGDNSLKVFKNLKITDKEKYINFYNYNENICENIIDKVNSICGDVLNNKQTIENIKNGFDFTLPTYWQDYLQSKDSDIKSKLLNVGGNGTVFQFFTDFHSNSNQWKSKNVLEYIKNKYNINNIVCGGDLLNAHTKDEAIDYLLKFVEKYNIGNMKVLFGNHELNGDGIGESYNSSDRWLNRGQTYSLIGRANEKHYTNKKFYFYEDNKSQKIRYIYLDTGNTHSYFYNDNEQINWFVNVLNSTEQDWNVVVFCHIFFVPRTDGVEELQETTNGYLIRTLLNAFEKRIVQADGSRSWDFTSAKAHTVCVITGHCHRDYSSNGYNYPIISTVCDANTESQNSKYNTLDRSTGTVNEQAVDLFFVNTNTKTIDTIRLGAGNNRSFTYGDIK